MNVKIDTKDKFTEITVKEEILSANMAEELNNLLLSLLKKKVPHAILNAENIIKIDEELINSLATTKEKFIESNASLVFCNLNSELQKHLDDLELLEFLNVTPTLSEAWDIIQMEEIERELLSDFDEETEEYLIRCSRCNFKNVSLYIT